MVIYIVESVSFFSASMLALHGIIFSILVSNMEHKSYKNARKKAEAISKAQTNWAQLTQNYIKGYIKKFGKMFRFYMFLKVFMLVFFLCSLFVLMFVAIEFGFDSTLYLWRVKTVVDIVILTFLLSHFGWRDRKTRYDRDCGRFP